MSDLFLQSIPGFWVLFLVLIALLGWGIAWRKNRQFYGADQQLATLRREQELMQTELDNLRDQSYHWQQQYQQQIQQQGQWQARMEYLDQLQVKNQDLEQQLSQDRTELARSQEKLEQLQQQMLSQENTEQRFKEAFENLAHQIFEQKSAVFRDQNQQSLGAILGPLRQQLDNFRQQVQQSYDTESRERQSLKTQVEQLQQLNQQMSEEALNLTRALKGDNKQQGNWGEVILSRILEESGLREGHEYSVQVVGKNQQGQTIKPDVIVELPHQRSVIIDSKVTLTAYERYNRSDDPAQKEQALQAHVRSLKGHISGLGKKNYQTLYGVQGLDYVLLFVPIEPAFQLAVQADPGLISLASQMNILLVSPSSLLVALRTIENLWRSEYQQRNAAEIALRAGRLYDKFCGFIEDMMALGQNLDKAQSCYDGALQKLSRGRGNLVRQAEQLRQMQIPTSKQMTDELIDDIHNESAE
ncbi:DNA recombination protein RmuC [Celerinatantimonas sp. YJH-8]|uniref:DNA recombination protein RmuC n=1 Tax=Celerinatantimonas sp. YJH-8 TaxID=3228714 RepID=UPI0038C15A51